ncbi:MAG: hypothetical protein JXR96_14085 [Deltaproteobacteria bacterium]|nr:hypothetical protein [Deltaproteobacteria bacterium]
MHRSLTLLALVAGWAAGCGDALSSLEAVERSARRQYRLELSPDWARRGDIVSIAVEPEPALEALLTGSSAYPSEIHFGPGTSLRSFDSQDGLTVTILVSPLAEEGERRPLMVFVLGDEEVEGRGRFWILPALPAN